MSNWQTALTDEWQKRQASQAPGKIRFPLVEQNFEPAEILAMAEVLLSGQLTMSHRVREFESKFAAYIGSPYAVFVNSGSSANLLAIAVALNPLRKNHLKPGDEVLIPAVCWSTSVWPVIQLGLKPVFVDVDPQTLNIDLASVKAKATSRTRALLMVHILGNSADLGPLLNLAQENQWTVIEDTCESLGSSWNEKKLGTLGDFGTYSFYFSHHMTTGEGGMVVCQTQEDVDLLKCLRAHGWTRELSDRAEVERQHPHVDPRFMFVNVGFNLRPMEIQAALGICQLAKLDSMNASRVENWKNLKAALENHSRWQKQLQFVMAPPSVKPVWFGFPVLVESKITRPLSEILARLSERGVENRPIVSGNFARQPGLELFKLETDWRALVGAEQIHQYGFFIGLHARNLSHAEINELAGLLLDAVGE